MQAIPQFKAVTKNVIAYEGITKTSGYSQLNGKSPVAQGDGPNWAPNMPPQTMFSVYGSGHVGFFGGVIDTTNVEQILKIDCRKLDMYRKQEAYPTYLFYNPYEKAQLVTTNVGGAKTDVYDAVSSTFIKRGVKNSIQFVIPADAARLLIFVPAGKRTTADKGILKYGGIPIDYGN